MSRERDVRNAMKTLLVATGVFSDDTVLIAHDSAAYAAGTMGDSIKIEPLKAKSTARWDAGEDLEVYAQAKVTITARHEDPQMRDEQAERLYNVARNALNDQSLADLTMPPWTGFESERWLPPEHPTRQIEAVFAYRYLQDRITFDESE